MPFGPFYCVFSWDLSKISELEHGSSSAKVRIAKENELADVGRVWHSGLAQEEGSPWADYLKRWTPTSASRWFTDSVRRLDARILVGERNEKIAGMNGIILEKRSGIGRLFTGVVVAPDNRKQGIGTGLLYHSLALAKKEGLRTAEVETIQGIPATKYLYPKFGGNQKLVPAV